MEWQHNTATSIWEMTEGGVRAIVFSEGNGLWNGYVEPIDGDEADRIFCPQLDPEIEHVKAWCMTEVARQEAAREA